MQHQKLLENSVSFLIQSYPFFGALMHQCGIHWTADLPTAAVRSTPKGNLEMVINPEFFCMLTAQERIGLLLHELYHIVNGHLYRFHGLNPQEANIAMDTAINQYIPAEYLPPGALMPDNVVARENKRRKKLNKKEIYLEAFQAFEKYYNILREEVGKDFVEKMQNPKQFNGELDNSSTSEESQKREEEKQQQEQENKEMTPEQKAKEEQMKKTLQALLEEEAELEAEKSKLLSEVNQEAKKMQNALVTEQDKIADTIKKMKLENVFAKSEEVLAEQKQLNKKMEGMV